MLQGLRWRKWIGRSAIVNLAKQSAWTMILFQRVEQVSLPLPHMPDYGLHQRVLVRKMLEPVELFLCFEFFSRFSNTYHLSNSVPYPPHK
jgi:hypothetical protein